MRFEGEILTEVKVIGGGLAGCEAAWQLANAEFRVHLYEMKPQKFSPAHHNANLAELVCSNSLKAARLSTAAGLLKEEMARCGSLLVPIARACAVPAGGALAVDREAFAKAVTAALENHPNITVHHEVVTSLPKPPAVVATGPLTDGALAMDIARVCGEPLHFFDAASPIVDGESIDYEKVFFAARYGRGDRDYLNCPMNRAEYEAFYEALTKAERAPLHEIDRDVFRVYEGCIPIEILASRGLDTMRFGPLKPVGLTDPKTGLRPWAVVQLRREDRDGRLYNLVGFQTNLRFSEQKRVFSMIPGLEHAVFYRYGVMHRNSFLNSPKILDASYSLRDVPGLYFAGQLTGVEGYMESAGSGLLAGQNLARFCRGEPPLILPKTTMLGALAHYVSGYAGADFQPMGANMGLLPPLPQKVRGKEERYMRLSTRALGALERALQDAD